MNVNPAPSSWRPEGDTHVSLGEQLRRSWSVMRPAQASAGLVASALGCTVVVAWLTRNEELTRVHSLFPPMPYSVAIGLLVSGVALLAGANGWRRLAGAGAVGVLALGFGTLVQYALRIDWNLHRALLSGLIDGAPAGMAPSNALSFLLIGVGLLAVSVRPKRGGVVCAISGATVAAQNGVAFVWNAFGLASSYAVNGDTPHVAMGLAVAGIGTIAAAWDGDQRSASRPPRWLPLPVTLGIALVSLSLWHQSKSDHQAILEQIARLRAERIGIDLNRRAAPLTDALRRLAETELASREGRVPIESQVLSALDLERLPSVFAIALVDRESGLRWIQTRSATKPSLTDLQVVEQACDLLLRRPVGRSLAIVDRRDLRAGGPGFAMVVPIGDEGPVRGFIVALLRYDDFFFAMIGEEVDAEYGLRVFGGQREIYRHSSGSSPANVMAAAAIPFFGADWRVQIWPRSVQSLRRPFADTTLVFGLVFAGLIGWTVELAQRTARSRNQLSDTKAHLRSAVAARQAAQAAQAETEVRYKQIIDAAADVIYRTDVKGRFTFVNPAAIRVTKWSRDELIGRSYLSLIRPDYRPTVRAFYEKQAAERISSTYLDFPVSAADGREVWIGQHAQLLTSGDHVVGFQAVARDINHRIRIQKELQRTQDAALEAARLKAEFVANTSHEIRTPLNGIVGFTNLLLESTLSEEQRTYAEGLRLSADALLAIVNDILDFSKIEAGMLRLEAVAFDLHSLISDSLLVFAEAAREKSLVMEAHIDNGLPRRVTGDPNRLRQVLVNLLANAVKFTDRGSITVTAAAQAGTDTQAVVARFSVSDTGSGIEPEAQPRIFEPFVQADGSTSRRHGGTGLGLAISRQIVELMGGSIEVESVMGSGSTFSFTARFERGVPIATQGPRAPGEPGGRSVAKEKADFAGGPWSGSTSVMSALMPLDRQTAAGDPVLVTDDNPVSQQVTRLLLEKLGYTVEIARNGMEAVQATSRQRYALILMDCQMPVMDGYDATTEIRRAENGRSHTPIIAFTASVGRLERERCLNAGMDDFLEKPIRKNELLRLVHRWASTSKQTTKRERGQDAPPDVQGFGPIDADTVDALEQSVGCEDVAQMIELHLEEADASIERMEQATSDERLAVLVHEAHRLKGGCMTLGFVRMGEICSDLEERAGRCTEDARREMLQRLKEACRDVRGWQRRRSGGRSSSI